MIRIQVGLPSPDPDPPDARAIASATSAAAGQMASTWPDYEEWEVTSRRGASRYNLRDALGRTKDFVLAVGAGANRIQVGQIVWVGYYNRNPARPFILAPIGVANWDSAVTLILFGLWSQPEGQPRIACASSTPQSQLKLSTESLTETLATLSRTADASPSGYDWAQIESSDVVGLLLFAQPITGTPTDLILACCVGVWDTNGAAEGSTILVTEIALAGTGKAPVTLTQAILRSTGNLPARQQGCFFLNQLANGDVIYTVVSSGGIASYLRSSPTAVYSNWVTDANRPAQRDINIGCVEKYLIEGSYIDPVIDGGNNHVPGGARIQLYTRNAGLAYEALAPVELDALASVALSGYADQWKTIFGVQGALNTRWPMLALGARREWWIYINCLNDPDAQWITAVINAITGSGSKINTFLADLSWRMLYEALVATEDAALTASADASRYYAIESIDYAGNLTLIDGSFPEGYTAEAVRFVNQFIQHDNGNPESDPPVPASDLYIGYWVTGWIGGRMYSGTIPQATGIRLTDGDPAQEKFYAAPLTDTGACPAGLFNGSGVHFGVCYEPQHYANNVSTVNDVPVLEATFENGAYTQYGGPYNQHTNYIYVKFRARTIEEGGDTHGLPGYPVDPPYVAQGSMSPDYYFPGGWVAGDEKLGNVDLGDQVYGSVEIYARNQHGEYDYESRWRTWLSCFNPDKSLRFRKDISRYYVDGPAGDFPACLQTPQKLNIRQWLALGDYLWILRDDYPDKNPGDDIQGLTTEPHIELYRIGITATLLARSKIHPTADVDLNYIEDGTSARMMIGVNANGDPYATVWSTWNYSAWIGNHIFEAIFSDGALASSEKWSTQGAFDLKPAGQPIAIEAANAVHHDGKLFWVDGGTTVMSKSSAIL